jgi:A/G-specific adenine glycosylase
MFPVEQLRKWFLQEQRDLPWRNDRSPYRVWISEVMLQQTQVAVVIPYFLRWMEKFPTLESLGAAAEDEVVKMWEGLGYYSRARNLHRAARLMGSRVPQSGEELLALPGFGSYTTGAVLSFAFQQKKAAVDGNVVRVLSRFFASNQDCSRKGYYEELAEGILPEHEPWVVMEALIELGAQVCQKKPRCEQCPLIEECVAYRRGQVAHFPVARKRPEIIQLRRQVAVVRVGEYVLVRQEKGKKVMSGLYEFPYAEEEFAFQALVKKIADFQVVKHGFTRYRVTLFPTLYEMKEKIGVDGYEWLLWDRLKELPFSSGHRRILRMADAYFTH